MVTQKHIYYLSYAIFYILYILSMIGFSFIAPYYLNYFTMVIKIYISLFLIWRFNIFRSKTPCTAYDKELIFTSAIFLLLTTAVGDYILNILPMQSINYK